MSSDSLGDAVRARAGAARDRAAAFANEHVVLTLLGPALLVILAVFVYPVLWMVYQSLFVSFPGLERQFDPLFNYRRMYESAAFRRYVWQTLVYAFGSLALSFSTGLAVALAINRVRRRWLRSTYTTLLLFAWAIPLAVVALMWRWILVARPYGLANRLLLDLGLIDAPISFFASGRLALATVVLADGWMRMPFAMIVFLAGLRAIPENLYEAASVDGATPFEQFRTITLPYLRPYMAIVALINWMFAFRAFSIIYPLTEGGPGTRTTTIAVEIYRRAMVELDFGYGAALSTFLVAVTALVAVFYVRVVLRRVEG